MILASSNIAFSQSNEPIDEKNKIFNEFNELKKVHKAESDYWEKIKSLSESSVI